jgi:hypothetical protein
MAARIDLETGRLKSRIPANSLHFFPAADVS